MNSGNFISHLNLHARHSGIVKEAGDGSSRSSSFQALIILPVKFPDIIFGVKTADPVKVIPACFAEFMGK